MDYSLDVFDPSLFTKDLTFSPSPLEYLSLHDFDLSSGESFLPFSQEMVPETIEPSQLSDFASPSATSSTLTTPMTSPTESTIDSPNLSRPHKRRTPSTDAHDHHVKRHQTKLACTWCRKLSKKCDEQRPCGRCRQFNRCDECVDAPPRRARGKGVERGTYKKTRELAVRNYPEAVARREMYIARKAKEGQVIPFGLSAEDLLENIHKEDGNMDSTSMMQTVSQSQPMMGNETTCVQGGSIPFTGPLENLFTCAQSPEIEELLLPPSPDTTLSSPSESLFELSTPVDFPLFPSYDVSDIDRALWEWEALENYPSVMELAALGKEAENPKFLQSWQGLQDQIEGLQPSSDVALAA